MKPIRSKSYLIKSILSALAAVFMLVGFLLTAKDIPFFPTVSALPVDLDINIEIAPGTMSLAMAGFYLSFICLYLIFEFYGFKASLYSAISSVAGIPVTYGIFDLLHRFALNAEESRTDELLIEIFSFRLAAVISYVLAASACLFTVLVCAAVLKRITKNYFMFIRFPIASIVGFSVFVASHIYLTQFNMLALESMVFEALPLASQFLALIIASVIPLYLLRLILGLFRGWSGDDLEDDGGRKGLFKTKTRDLPVPEEPAQNTNHPPVASHVPSTSVPIPLSKPVSSPVNTTPKTTAVQTQPSQPSVQPKISTRPAANDNLNEVIIEDEDEDYTVSKKIKFNSPAMRDS